MKYLLLVLACLLPFPALASGISDCDKKPYEVTINNAGQIRTVTITPASAMIIEYGPQVSFQLKDQKPVTIRTQDEEYCIWDGKIKLQRISSVGSSISSNHLR